MLKKIVLFLLAVVWVLSLAGLGSDIVSAVRVRHYFRTTMVITFIGTPDGALFGTYTDQNGEEHVNVPAYVDSAFSGHSKNVEQYYGKEVEILYDAETGDIWSYENLRQSIVISAAVFAGAGMLIYLLGFRRKKQAS